MDNKLKRFIAIVSIIPIMYALGYYKGKKKGEGMLKLADEILARNCKEVEFLHKQTTELQRLTKEAKWALEQIEEWKQEHPEAF